MLERSPESFNQLKSLIGIETTACAKLRYFENTPSFNQLKSLIGIETRQQIPFCPHNHPFNQLKSLIGIETKLLLLFVESTQLLIS